MKFLSKYRIPVTPEEKKQRRKERLLLILSGIVLGISFPPIPFPFTLLIFVGLIPYFIVIKKRTTLASISKATFLFSLVFSLVTNLLGWKLVIRSRSIFNARWCCTCFLLILPLCLFRQLFIT